MIFSRSRKADIGGMNVICCWKFAETDLISCDLRRNSRRYPAGDAQNFLARLAGPNWHTRIRSKPASEQPSLSDMVRRAIELLQFNRSGYFLVVDAGLMRKAAEKNNGEHTLAETVELDRALAVAQRYAGGKSAIFVCGDVGIGGLSLNGYPFRKDRGIAVLGLNSAGDPWFSWATGPNGERYYGAAKLAASQDPQATGSMLRRQNSRRSQSRSMRRPH